MELLIDGVRYKLWTPKDEAALEDIVKKHAKDIFGEDSIYFDIKQTLRSQAGIGSKPDGYVIAFEDTPQWYIVEVELSSHPLHEHIMPQMSRFSMAIENPKTQRLIVDATNQEVKGNVSKRALLQDKIGAQEIHEFLSDLISNPPVLVVVIEEKTKQLEDVCAKLPLKTKVVEFRTFEREGVGLGVHAHLFEPIWKPVLAKQRTHVVVCQEEKLPVDKVEIQLGSIHSHATFGTLSLPKKEYRHFLPGYKEDFILETDVGNIVTRVTSAPQGTRIGDPNAGAYIQGGLRPWYKKHPELKSGDRLIIEAIEPQKRYRLKIR